MVGAARSSARGVTPAEQIRARIADIPEPCALSMRKTTTIGQMGLIESVDLTNGHATITLCLTDTACVHFASMQAFIADVLCDMPEVTSVAVVQTTTELWTPDRMAAA